MPGGNRTGPFGQGSKTGRGLGFCSESDQPGFQNSKESFGYGNGRGWRNRWGRGNHFRFRHGFGNFSFNEPANVSELTWLENEARALKEQLGSIEKQLSDLKKETD